MYNLATAAAAVGRNKNAILRAIEAGKIPASQDANGDMQIDPADLHRVYPPLRTGDVQQQTTGGLLYWRKSTNTPAFTDGEQHWALQAGQMVTWGGRRSTHRALTLRGPQPSRSPCDPLPLPQRPPWLPSAPWW